MNQYFSYRHQIIAGEFLYKMMLDLSDFSDVYGFICFGKDVLSRQKNHKLKVFCRNDLNAKV